MATTEAARNQLYNRLIEVLGADSAETLMSSLPPIPATTLATKDDFKGVKGEIAALREEMREGFKELRNEVRTEIAAVNQRLDLELAGLHRRLDRAFMAQIATLVTVVAAIFASNALF